MVAGGVGIALWKQYQVAQIEIRDAERQADERRAARRALMGRRRAAPPDSR